MIVCFFLFSSPKYGTNKNIYPKISKYNQKNLWQYIAPEWFG